jgi:hypothetical protein
MSAHWPLTPQNWNSLPPVWIRESKVRMTALRKIVLRTGAMFLEPYSIAAPVGMSWQ